MSIEDQHAAKQEGLLFPGTYNFKVVYAQEAISRNGNEMIKLTLHVYDVEGDTWEVQDYLLESFPKKLKHAAQVCGLLGTYLTGELRAIDFEGATGRVRIDVQAATEIKGRNGEIISISPRNSVVDYVGPMMKRERKLPFVTKSGIRIPSVTIEDEVSF